MEAEATEIAYIMYTKFKFICTKHRFIIKSVRIVQNSIVYIIQMDQLHSISYHIANDLIDVRYSLQLYTRQNHFIHFTLRLPYNSPIFIFAYFFWEHVRTYV